MVWILSSASGRIIAGGRARGEQAELSEVGQDRAAGGELRASEDEAEADSGCQRGVGQRRGELGLQLSGM